MLSKIDAHEPSASNEPVTIYQVVKRFPSRNSTNVVWECAATVAGGAIAARSPLQVTAGGWARLLPMSLKDGSIGAVVHEVKTITLTPVEPALSSPQGMQSDKPSTVANSAVASLVRLLPMLVDKKEAQAHQVMENVLLDAFIAAKRA